MNMLYQKKEIAQSFSKAAHTYDAAAQLQRYTGNLLLSMMEGYRIQPNFLMDVGSGTGYFSKKLAQQYATSQVLGLDIATGMIEFANQWYTRSNLSYVCADIDQREGEQEADLIFSNLMLQWSPEISHTFNMFRKLLKPAGYLFFSTLGPCTLFELKAAWKKVDSHAHVHSFFTKEQMVSFLKKNAFHEVHLKEEKKQFSYPSLLDLLLNIKALGAHNLQNTRLKGLWGKGQWLQLREAYQTFQTPSGQFPATYDIIYGVAV